MRGVLNSHFVHSLCFRLAGIGRIQFLEYSTYDIEISRREAPSRIFFRSRSRMFNALALHSYTRIASGSGVLAEHSDWLIEFHDFEISWFEAPSRIAFNGVPEYLARSLLILYTRSTLGFRVLGEYSDSDIQFYDIEISSLGSSKSHPL